MNLNKKIVCSFCHAYLDNKLRDQKKYPALVTLERSNLKKYSYVFLKRMLNTFVGRVFMLVGVLVLASKNKTMNTKLFI